MIPKVPCGTVFIGVYPRARNAWILCSADASPIYCKRGLPHGQCLLCTIMVFLLVAKLALAFLGLQANVKSNNDTALGIAAIQAHFKNAYIVPNLLPTFNPSAIMNVAFPGVGPVSPGQTLSMQQTATAPEVIITPANSSVPTTGNF